MGKKLAIFVVAWSFAACIFAQTWETDVARLIESSCLDCHAADTETRLDLSQLGHDLADPETFRQWVRIFDRVQAGEMPPPSTARPAAAVQTQAMTSLETALRRANRTAQARHGRVPARRLTRLEYEYTLRDLLQIEESLAQILPAESDSGGFDTVGDRQGISPVHIRKYLQAADLALDAAIQLDQRPASRRRLVDYLNSPYVNRWYDIPLNEGGGVIKKLDDAVALFVDLDYILRSDACGLAIRAAGQYKITVEAYAYQAKSPVTLKLILASEQRGGAKLLGAFDLQPEENRSVAVTTRLQPGDYLYPSVADLDPHAGVYSAGGAKHYTGEGIAIKSLHVEGPLLEQWPPASTQRLLAGVQIVEPDRPAGLKRIGEFLKGLDPTHQPPGYAIRLSQEPLEHVTEIVSQLAMRAFRRPPRPGEVESFIDLARPAIAADREFIDVVRIPVRSLLSSPQFLFFGGQPGELDDFALASRLSYFLWKSMPDEELLELAALGELSDPAVLARQADRLLADGKSSRFHSDFLGQWLRLYEVHATTPDENLYPEFDDQLNQALRQETELFFAELVRENLSVNNLIDADFTFLNRRLAEHYGLHEDSGTAITGQHFRKVKLPADSPRGGVLTQASVLKVTANGTVTSPVTRGNFVLTNLLGQPPHPPPPNVGSIEPDTRGTTTIRELLAAHRDVEACASCHRQIDPPGFALECFDPIGGFRTRYRATTGRTVPFQSIMRMDNYRAGPPVDASGVTAAGQPFANVHEFKQLLLKQNHQVARHLVTQLVIYATGAEIQFADREAVEQIVRRTSKQDFPVRTIIHEVVQSELFRNK